MKAADLRRYAEPGGELAFVREQIKLADGRTVGEALADDEWIETDLLRPVFARDDAGLPRFRLVYHELPRGHWKSGGAAAIAVAEALLHASTDVVIAAADRDQAAIVLEVVEGYLARNPALRSSFRRRGDEFVVPARHSRIRVISSDAPTAWGLGGTHRRFRVISDELTNWKKDDLWIALASATGKTRDGQTIVISNAGVGQGEGWQWKVRETAATESWGYLLTVDGVLASWIDDAWVEQMRALLPGPAFDRAILNRWSSESGDFVSRAQWRRCVDPRLREGSWTPAHGATYAGLDLGLVKDRTALAVVHVDLDGQTVVLDELLVWQGSRDEPVDISTVERAVVDAKRRYPTLRVSADPWQLRGSIQRLNRDGVFVREHVFSQGSIAKLSSSLYAAISDASLKVFDDPELEREVLGLQVVQTASGWRIDHRAGGYSDRVVALAMALGEAVRNRRLPGAPVERREPVEHRPTVTAGAVGRVW